MKKRTLKHIFFLTALVMFLLPGRHAEADENREVIRVGCLDNDNFMMDDGTGVIKGYGADYLNEISKYTGWQYEYVQATWEESLGMLEEGTLDLLFPAQYSKERGEKYAFSQLECCVDNVALLTYADNESLFYEDYEGFENIVVGMIEGNYLNGVFDKFAEENGFSYRAVYYLNYEEMRTGLQEKEVDAVVMGKLISGDAKKVLASIGYVPGYFIGNKENKELMEKLNEAMGRIMSENPRFTAELTERYYGVAGQIVREFTKEEEDYIENGPKVRVAYHTNAYPFEWLDEESGECKGISRDILEAVSQKSGLRFEYVPEENCEEVWAAVENGEADLICNVYIDKYLEEKYGLMGTGCYMTKDCIVVGQADRKLYPAQELVVAVRKSAPDLQEYIRTNYPNWKLKLTENTDECFELVSGGDADAALISLSVLQTEPVLLDYPELVILPNITSSVPVQMGVGKDAPKLLLSVMDKSILLLKDDDIQAAIVNNTLVDRNAFSLKNIIHYYPELTVGVVFAMCLVAAVVIFFLYHIRMKSRQAMILESANRKLSDANVAKTDFLSRMSHDIRTPMNGIIGITRLLLDKELPAEVQADLRKIDSSAQYLLGLVNDILDMTKVENGEIELNPAPYPFRKLVNYINSIIVPQCKEKRIELRLRDTGMEQTVLMVDALRINQIVLNLLSNAMKFTPEGGWIELSVENAERKDGILSADYVIKDNGIGMSEEFQEHMYETFSRENRSLDNVTEGIGLGLAIVRRLVEYMNGTILVKSEVGIGTEFRIHLSFPYREESEEEKKEEKELKWKCLKGRRILVCEDHPLNREIVERILEKQGMKLEFAENGAVGLEMFTRSKPGYYDLILMDIRMPVMDGLEAARAIRAADRPDALFIPIVAMTANAYQEDRRMSREAGMDAHLSKPVDVKEFLSTLSKLLVRDEG